MKIYINRKPIQGPWGGGNKFVKKLVNNLKNNDFNVTYDLTSDVNIIFCFDPRPNDQNIWYQNFLNHKYQFGSKIIQRVGDVGTHSKPELTKILSKPSCSACSFTSPEPGTTMA